jgi:uncharacterized membrane protein HdeD (DUF308 family)
MKNNKKEKDISTILIGLLSFIFGGLLICATEDLLTTFNYLLVCIFSIIGAIEIISFFTNKDYIVNYYNKLFVGGTFIWLALILYKYYVEIINILPIIFSLYLFIMGTVLIIKYNTIRKSLSIKYKVYIIMAILAIIMGILLIFEPLWSVYIYLKLTGVYVIILSVLFFYEFFKNIKFEKK